MRKFTVAALLAIGLPILANAQWAVNGNNINNTNTGYVGIGTTSPDAPLDVESSGTFTFFRITAAAASPNIAADMTFTDGGASGKFRINIVDGDGPELDIDSDGNLTVAGNLAAKYQDVAEWVPSDDPLAPGTVVVIDTTQVNEVRASGQAYDSHVAGVVSQQPGLALGVQGDGKYQIATVGRVRVKADAANGPIAIGDLLVTSGVTGTAMKSEPVKLGDVEIHRPGTLLGKALEPLASGQGQILVLLSLQ